MSKNEQLQQAIEDAALRFAQEILTAIRSATLEELVELTNAAPATTPARRGRPPKVKEAVSAPAVEIEEPAKKPRKKRIWPKCSVEGCETNVYMPSGPKKMCYQHHVEAGGAPTPLLGARKKGKAEKSVKATEVDAPAPKRRGRPTKKAAPAPSIEATEPEKKARKKRVWPKCSVDGCETNLYMPSGPKKMCYAHHMEAGGKPSPVIGARKGKTKAKARKPAKAVEVAPAKTEKTEPKAKTKRNWPKCCVEGCNKGLYAASGTWKMCYRHYVEAGGQESPLVRARKKKAEAAANAAKEAKAKPSTRKTITRKKGQAKAEK